VLDQSDRFLAVVLAVPNPGRSAMVFASQTHTEGEIALVGRLLNFACERLAQIGLHLAQALLATDELPAHEAFKRGGFRTLATLSYLERPLRSRLLPPQPRWPKGVTIGQYDDSLRKELGSVLDATYEETLDCPGLRGHRSTSDILDGHRAVGDFDPALWTILHVDHEPAGLLLLNPAADHASIELVYLGLAKRARHRGLGRSLLRHGLHIAAGRPERLMTLAVDEANEPALRLYKREHFRKVLRRAAMIRPLRPTIA
jgi:ribosomal protein S18 acetylase RimI-like enzyme